MIDFEEELKRFKPSLETEPVDDELTAENDMVDLMIEMADRYREEHS